MPQGSFAECNAVVSSADLFAWLVWRGLRRQGDRHLVIRPNNRGVSWGPDNCEALKAEGDLVSVKDLKTEAADFKAGDAQSGPSAILVFCLLKSCFTSSSRVLSLDVALMRRDVGWQVVCWGWGVLKWVWQASSKTHSFCQPVDGYLQCWGSFPVICDVLQASPHWCRVISWKPVFNFFFP